MPDESLDLPTAAKDPVLPSRNPEGGRKPAIRTMHSDLEELLKTAKPTMGRILQEHAQREASFLTTARATRSPLRIIAILFILIMLAGGAAAWFLLPLVLSSRPTPAPAATSPAPAPLLPRATPPPFFATETARTMTLDAQERVASLEMLETALAEPGREGTMERVIIKVKEGPQERFATMLDFLAFYRINVPPSLQSHLRVSLMAFVSHAQKGNQLGLAAKVTDGERVLRDFILWEPSLAADLAQLFFHETVNPVAVNFEDRTYRNIDWRYLRLSVEKDIGIAYALFPAGNVLILTTGKTSMETAISRLFGIR